MYTTSKAKGGGFGFTVYDLNNELYAQGNGYPCHIECERTAQLYNREAVLMRQTANGNPIQADYMTPEEFDAAFAAMLEEV